MTKVSEENMRQEKLFRRWRAENGEQEQPPEGRHALGVSGRLTWFLRRQRGSRAREDDERSIKQCASSQAHNLF